VIILGFFACVAIATPWMGQRLREMLSFSLAESGSISINGDNILTMGSDLISYFVISASPFLLGLVGVGLVVGFAQVGWHPTLHPLTPNLGTLNPVQGVKRMVSANSLFELGKAFIKIGLVGTVAYLTVSGAVGKIFSLVMADPHDAVHSLKGVLLNLGFRVGLLMLILALVDYLFQRWQFEKRIRMTKAEVKEEQKQMEGDMLVKGRVRAMQRQILRRRMMQKVPDADVVITNPTHLAVALQYVPEHMFAPRVVAKGARLIAEKIKEIAREHDVPIVENKPLAQALYKGIEVGQEVPAELYSAVAEILAYVYRLRGKVT
jgi:flagellar biosynthetic protein FlhB